MGFKEAAYAYLDESQRRHAEKTYKHKASCYKLFLEYLGQDKPINEITALDVDRFLKSRPSNNNFNVHRKELYALFTYAKETLRVIDYNPCWDIERMPHTPSRKVIPTEQQILQLIVAADPEEERPLFLVTLHSLGRIDEVLRLAWLDVNFENRVITLWTRKRKGGAYEADPLPMNQDLYEVLRGLWEKRMQNKWVFKTRRSVPGQRSTKDIDSQR